MEVRGIDLIYLDGCPNADAARSNLRVALERRAAAEGWREWELSSDETPEGLRGYGSPTVLVDGRDVAGDEGGAAAMACRAEGAPSVESILRALDRAG